MVENEDSVYPIFACTGEIPDECEGCEYRYTEKCWKEQLKEDAVWTILKHD